jgi:homoserine O-acetyltransferase
MKDEYGEMTSEGETFVKKKFALENGAILPEAQLRYQTYGNLNSQKDNVIVVCHALTGNASLHSWWGDLLGKNKVFDTGKYLIVCCNILGSCYGSTSPQSIDPETGTMYGKAFPDISVQDTVKLQLHLLQEELGIASIKTVIGGSFGGMQAMEFAVQAGSTYSDFLCEDGEDNNLENFNHFTNKSNIFDFQGLHTLGQSSP